MTGTQSRGQLPCGITAVAPLHRGIKVLGMTEAGVRVTHVLLKVSSLPRGKTRVVGIQTGLQQGSTEAKVAAAVQSSLLLTNKMPIYSMENPIALGNSTLK